MRIAAIINRSKTNVVKGFAAILLMAKPYFVFIFVR